MKKLFDPGYWGRALTRPIVLAGLAIDLAPVYAVLVWGWGAAPLVLLYWIENLVAGVMTLPRIFLSGANFGGLGLFAGLLLSAFFVFHYGLFCAGHGTFLMAFLSTGQQGPSFGDIAMDIPAMLRVSLETGQYMLWMVTLIIAWQAFILVWEFGVKGEWRRTNPAAEMIAPYARIVVLHVGLFAGMAALIFLGEPMIGVLALIVLRALWGIIRNARSADINNDSTSTTQSQFAAMLRGEDSSR